MTDKGCKLNGQGGKMRIGVEATVGIKGMAGVSEYFRQLISHLSKVDHDNQYELATTALFRGSTMPLPPLGDNFHEHKVMLPAKIVDTSLQKFGFPPLSLFTGKCDLLFYPRPIISNLEIPSVVTVHDLSWIIMPELAGQSDHALYRKSLERVAKSAASIITISQSTKNDLVRLFNVDPAKITVIYIGYDENLKKEVEKEQIDGFRRQFKLGEAPYILHLGTLEPRKNLVRLVQAFTKFKESTKLPHKLVLAGRYGWLYENILDAVSKSSTKEDIHVIGPIDSDIRPAAYWGADFVAFPSLYEGFGLPIIEAQAARRPVLTGTGGSLKEVGEDSVLSVNVKDESEIAKGLIKLAQDEKLRAELIEKGLNNIKRFSWDRCASETLKVFQMTVH